MIGKTLTRKCIFIFLPLFGSIAFTERTCIIHLGRTVEDRSNLGKSAMTARFIGVTVKLIVIEPSTTFNLIEMRNSQASQHRCFKAKM